MSELYEKILKETQMEFPKFQVVPKDESPFMRFLAKLLFFNKQFMTGFTTTIGNYMWVTADFNSWSDESRAALLRHERVHLRQQVRYGMLRYVLMYLVWPTPFFRAYGRMMLEREAYTESMEAYAEYFGVEYLERPGVRNSFIKNFTSGAYGWMWTKREDIARWYDTELSRIRAEHY